MEHIRQVNTAYMDRPYEKCLHMGPQSLSDAQLLAVILRTGTVGSSAEKLAEMILNRRPEYGGILSICHATLQELMDIPGVGEVKAIQIQCIGELSKRISSTRAKSLLTFSDPASIAEYYMERLRHLEQELLVAMFLDCKYRLISEEVMTIGTVNTSPVSVREIFIAALRFKAMHVIVVHNHPSGDPYPSDADISITRKIAEAGRIIDITLSDHLIVGDKRYYSFRQEGILSE